MTAKSGACLWLSIALIDASSSTVILVLRDTTLRYLYKRLILVVRQIPLKQMETTRTDTESIFYSMEGYLGVLMQ